MSEKGDIEVVVNGKEIQEKLKNRKTYGTKLVDSGGCPALAAEPPPKEDQPIEKPENLEKTELPESE